MLVLLAVEFELLWEALHVLGHFGGFAIRSADLTDPKERNAIEAFVAAQADSKPFHRPAWVRGVEVGTGQRAHYLIAESGGRIVGTLPLNAVKSPLFGNALVSAGFAVGGGVLSSAQAVVEAMAEAASRLAEREKCAVVELRGGPVPAGWASDKGLYAGFERELPSGDQAILESIPRKQRAEVRRSLDQGLEIRIGSSENLLALHYEVYAESVRNLGTPVFPRRLFEAMADEWKDNADIVVISAGPRPVAAVLSLYDRGTVYPYWGGGTDEARKLRGNNLLYFALMRHASERGCTRFDFGRSKVGTGAYAFKANWGFAPRPMMYARQGRPRDVNPLSPRHRVQSAIWKRLPLPIANRLGPLISRGLG